MEAHTVGHGRRWVIPRVGERCFVPETVWPDEPPAVTASGMVGWWATITRVQPEAVAFVCDGCTEHPIRSQVSTNPE